MNEKKVLKRIGVLSFARMYAIIGAIIGLFLTVLEIGLFYLIKALGIQSAETAGLTAPTGSELAASIILNPLFFAALGFVMAVIFSWLYNLLAKWIGGVKVEFDK
jgi:hypothetical protein